MDIKIHPQVGLTRQRSASFSGFSSNDRPADMASSTCRMSNPVNTAATSMTSTRSTISFCSDSSLSHSVSPLPQDIRMESWMYWATRSKPGPEKQRMLHKLRIPTTRHRTTEHDDPRCFTKVYAVLRNEFLFLYANNQSSHRRHVNNPIETPLVHIAVSCAGRSALGAFLVRDPHGEEMELHLYDPNEEIGTQWDQALEQATDLTQSHFESFKINVEELPRTSLYRGSLHDLRLPKTNLITLTLQKIGSMRSRWNRHFKTKPATKSRYVRSETLEYSI